ncbi:MAG: queuosine precursor transporter [Candidatus Thermoplasmatota archaeon]|nr:queuosine precursor transporter [Candidatus Thermoplasmatota archaeon]
MENEILWFGLLFFNLLMVVLSYRLFGKIGLFVWTAVAVILANIQVMKTIEIFGLVTALGNVVYSSLFLVTDILNENHSKQDALKAVWIGFFVLISMTVLMQITLQFIPHESDTIHPHIVGIFQYMPRIALASLIAYLISQSHDVWFYSRLKNRLGSRYLWIRNNLSTITSQLIDNIVFSLIAFVGVEGFTWAVIAQIFFTSLVLKGIVAFFDTPFVYWARSIRESKR